LKNNNRRLDTGVSKEEYLSKENKSGIIDILVRKLQKCIEIVIVL